MSLEQGQPVFVWDYDIPFFGLVDHCNRELDERLVCTLTFPAAPAINSWKNYRLPTEEEMDTIGLDKNRWKYTKD